ncbi:MAG TPA: DUF222 domain-containing protein [Microbacteriaceae bacterium]
MNQPLQPLQNDLASLAATWDGALPAFGAARGSSSSCGEQATAVQTDLESMSEAGLVATIDALGRLAREVNGLLARGAAEVARRSPVEAGREGFAKRQGFLNPPRLVAAATGGSVSEATRLVSVGTATAARQSLTGEQLPPAHPHVAAALAVGAISVEAASAITAMLDRVARRADPAQTDAYEQVLAEKAADIPLENLLRVIREAEARLDQDGVQPREDELRADRFLHFRTDQHGMTHLRAALDPESAAPIKAAIEAVVTHTLRAKRDAERRRQDADITQAGSTDGDTDGLLFEDTRTIPQLQADALAMIATHAIGCNRVPAAHSTTLVIRASLKTLMDGVGFGQIDGIDQPVSAGTIRKLAAGAGIIPLVMGTDSVPLDEGRAARLFTPAQRIALAERDGGCACCGLGVAYTQAHHIRWWERDTGPTDLINGVLLCPPCHTRMHNDGWIIRVTENGQVWFTPPPHVDPDQTPRLGGKARYGLPELDETG